MSTYLPTFFNEHLTGAKTSTGFFNPDLNPINNINHENYDLIDSSFTVIPGFYNRKIRIPVYFINKDTYEKTSNLKPYAQYKSILTLGSEFEIKISLIVHTIELEYKGRISQQQLNKTNIMFEPTLLIQDLTANSSLFSVKPNNNRKSKSRIFKAYSQNPGSSFKKLINELCSEFSLDDNLKLALLNQAAKYLKDFNLADQLSNQINIFINDLPALANKYKSANYSSFWETVMSNASHYALPIKTYQKIAKHISTVNKIMRQQELSTNEYLLLLSNLGSLNKIKSQLPTVANNKPVPAKFNKDQKAVISTDQPLSLLQSVAGSGKSSTILGRIDYLLNNSIPADKITVLSFTNAASNHIKELNPNINSLTIAKLVHDTYQQNYQHILSNTQTLINSLNLFVSDKNTRFQTFIDLLNKLDKSEDNDNILKLMHFISLNQNQVLSWLNAINQTNLILELILVYLNLDSWHSICDIKYLIVDEVQDTSIFQFIYLLKLAAISKANVLFVGDASQTLYEFRGADPNALNILEQLKLFTAYKLQINYRSNPAILQYANKILDTISANKYANLQLKPAVKTNDSFSDHVKYQHIQIKNTAPNLNELEQVYDKNLYDFIQTAINKHEQIAILSSRRDTANLNYRLITEHYPNLAVANLTMPQPQDLNLISNYLNKFGQELYLMPSKNLNTLLKASIYGKLPDLVSYTMLKNFEVLGHIIQSINTLVDKFWTSELDKLHSNVITREKAINALQSKLLSYEIEYNTNNQTYFDQSANQTINLAKNSDIIISTIHGVKGLEFDNAIVFANNTAHLTQADKRLYYVACTRAKNLEYIVECSKNLGSQINSAYINCNH